MSSLDRLAGRDAEYHRDVDERTPSLPLRTSPDSALLFHSTCECFIHLNLVQDGRPKHLTGWAAVENHLTTQDKSLVDGFNDDINTLLTFVSVTQNHSDAVSLIYFLCEGWVVLGRADSFYNRLL